jgi:SulP family sulfate permease
MHERAPPYTPPSPSFVELFTPKLVTVFREGYGLSQLQRDVLSGLTVAVVALPLSMAIAIASGVSPGQGLYAAIFGGFIVSALGGSRFQIGGPAGAFIVLVAASVQRHGVDGMLLATLMAGLVLLAIGLLRLGTYVKFIPYPVTVGFTSGIAVIIAASQVKELLGLTLAVPEPGPFLDKLPVLWAALPSTKPAAIAVALTTIVIIVGIQRWRPHWPSLLIGVAVPTLLAAGLQLEVETIGTRFGGIPSSLPVPMLPPITLEKVKAVLPDAIAFALLGAIESLLSAVVADGMTGRRHRSNCELVAQGFANIAGALFSAMPVTGTIARTATNVRSGAHGPIAGMSHAVFVMLFILVAAPLASAIPLATLGGVLAVVAWTMAERHAFGTLLRASPGDAVVVLATFGLTVLRDLTEAIVVGFALGAVIFIHRMSQSTAVETHAGVLPPIAEDQADTADGQRRPYTTEEVTDRDVVVYRISGAFFFGAASTVGAVLDRIEANLKALVIDMEAVPVLDSTAAVTIAGLARKARRQGVKLYITGSSETVRHELMLHGARPPLVNFKRTIGNALTAFRTLQSQRLSPKPS